jgi:hypothetical protein
VEGVPKKAKADVGKTAHWLVDKRSTRIPAGFRLGRIERIIRRGGVFFKYSFDVAGGCGPVSGGNKYIKFKEIEPYIRK